MGPSRPKEDSPVDFEFSDAQKAFVEEVDKFIEENYDS